MSSEQIFTRFIIVCAVAVGLAGCGDSPESAEKPAATIPAKPPSSRLRQTRLPVPVVPDALVVKESRRTPVTEDIIATRKAFRDALLQGDDPSIAIDTVIDAEGLIGARKVIETLHGDQRFDAFGGWYIAACNADLELAKTTFRADVAAMVDAREKTQYAYFGTQICRALLESNQDVAEAFALSLEPGIPRMNALEPLIYKILQVHSNNPDRIVQALTEAMNRWNLTPDERAAISLDRFSKVKNDGIQR